MSEGPHDGVRYGLRWVRQQGGAWYGYSGELMVAMLGERDDGEGGTEWWYSVDAVRTKWITKGFGEVASERSAKRACDRAWNDWLARAGLMPINHSTRESESAV